MAGRKSKYESHVKPHLEEIKGWCKEATEAQICQRLGVGKSTWAEYKKQFPELQEAIKKGHQVLVQELRGALIKRAKGYQYTETKVIKQHTMLPEEMEKALMEAGFSRDDIMGVRIRREETAVKEMPPDVAAINLALKNYDKDNWANDPQMLSIRKEELELRRKQVENNEW